MKLIFGMLQIACLCFINLNIYAQHEQSGTQTENELSDSLLQKYSVEELLQFKRYYVDEITRLEGEKDTLRNVGIEETEAFLKTNTDSKILDKILMRLAELYYQRADDDYMDKLQAYDDALERHDKGDTREAPSEPERDFTKSLEMYKRIITDFPQSMLYDDALYNIGFIWEQMAQKDSALVSYRTIIDEFPDSRYVPSAMMRIAEYYFNPPVNDLQNAIKVYEQVLHFKDSPKYDEALYRLGWSYYRLDMYPEAVSYFTLLADDVERSKILDPGKKYTNPDLRDESVEYIGISFLDYGGAEGAAAYLNDIGGRAYGLKVLQKIGDAYMEAKEEYENAINSYSILLEMYPDSPDAPKIQNKIVKCYLYLDDDRMAYFSRDKIFTNYKPGSEWWQHNDDEKVRIKARTLTESAILENITLLFQRATESNDSDLFLQVITDSRKYIKSFPEDSNTALIHWNMAWALDTKLKQNDLAFNEYMKISDLYWDTKYQKFAAENAIVLAREAASNVDSIAQHARDISLAVGDTLSAISANSNFRKALVHKDVEMSAADQRLADAYNNYIMLFPHEPETAMILTNAGALYYNHNQFQKALKYYNTLVKHFPSSKDVDYATYTVMECYFGKRDFKSSEIVAKKLRESAKTGELSRKAVRRLAESVYLSAEALAESGEHLKAGNEYVRVVVEVPDAPFADLALFNGAFEYDKAQEFRRAAETYDYLVENYPKSKYRLDAINNLAIDYGELKEDRNAAITYEKLAAQHPDTTKARDALYNSSVFYVRAEDWKSSIRVNQEYVRKYPDSEDADDLYFDIAGYHLKIGEIEKANRIYGGYALKYPESPRVVETYYRRGEYYLDNNNKARALQEFDLAILKSAELKGKNINSNDYYAAEALFRLTEIRFDELDEIEFRMPQTAMEEAKKKKKELLLLIVENYTRVARYGTIRLYQATYNIAHAYEEFAETWAGQELPPMSETRKIVALKEVNQTAAELYERSISSFQNSVNVLTRIADDFEAAIEEKETASTDSSAENTIFASKKGKITLEDSTLYVARKWIERSKEKVSEIIYDVAELSYQSVENFLAAPIPEDLDKIAEIEYRNQVLNRAVRPLIQQIVDSHTRNINVAHEMNLENQWVELSKNRVIAISNILSKEYQKMAENTFQLYGEKDSAYHTSINAGKDAVEIADQMVTLIDYSKALGKAAITCYKNALSKGHEASIDDPLVYETEFDLLKSALLFSQISDSLAAQANTRKKQYESLFKENDRIEFEDGLLAMDDNYFSLKDAQKEFLELGYNISKEMGITNPLANSIILELVRTNPEEYGDLLELKPVTMIVYTDASWQVIPKYKKGWTAVDFNTDEWEAAYVVMDEPAIDAENTKRIWCMITDTIAIDTPVEFRTQNVDSLAADSSVSTFDDSSAIMEPQIVASDSGSDLAVIQSFEYRRVSGKRAFFRKNFKLKGLPVSGQIKLSADDSYNLFFNGEYIAATDGADSTGWDVEKTYNLTDFLRAGQNNIAIECTDEDKTGSGLRAIVKAQALPGWQDKQNKLKFRMLDNEVRQNLIFNKNVLIF